MSIPNEALQKVREGRFAHSKQTFQHAVVADYRVRVVDTRNRNPGRACPARSQHREGSYRRQTAGHAAFATHLKRAGPTPERHERLRRRREDVNAPVGLCWDGSVGQVS